MATARIRRGYQGRAAHSAQSLACPRAPGPPAPNGTEPRPPEDRLDLSELRTGWSKLYSTAAPGRGFRPDRLRPRLAFRDQADRCQIAGTRLSYPRRIRGRSSVGRAPGLQPGGRGFESLRLQFLSLCKLKIHRETPYAAAHYRVRNMRVKSNVPVCVAAPWSKGNDDMRSVAHPIRSAQRPPQIR